MPLSKNSRSVIDYRNARYQGHIDSQSNRQSLGILIDDDLSFYVSHWKNNLLDGETLVYIAHGKYIYGKWLNNQPHGLNVFRTGDTVLVGQFKGGRIIGKILAIFQRYNIIAVLQTKSQKDRFDVIQCGKLNTHDDLLKYIDLLDVEMPDNYFSLIKFVTSLTDDDEESELLIASPCQGQNCYFGYRDGLAIIFNSNNGVVSVGQHENKQLNGFGGKFDGKKIQQGNFQCQQTITYSKKRPDNQIYSIFQKMHKRSLNFKNQYFDSKVKTLGDLQSILRGNIQKIINYNLKNGIREATAQDLNDSLDYQNLDDFQSNKIAQNRQNMYQKQHINLKKTTSQYYKQQRDKSASRLSSNINVSQSNTKRLSRFTENQSNKNSNIQQTVRKTPNKDSSVYYAKKSPIRFKQEDKQVYGKQSKTNNKNNQTFQQQSLNQKYIPGFLQKPQRSQGLIGKTYKRNSVYQKPDKPAEKNPDKVIEKAIDRSPLNNSKNFQVKLQQRNVREKIPKFGGLQLEQNEKNFHKSTVEYEVEEYKKQLQRSRSKQRPQGKSLSKYLKRPNYQDIEQRRKRLLNQFQQLNDSKIQSKVSNISDIKRTTPHKMSLEIDVHVNSRQSENKINDLQSPCMKQNIISYTSENQNNNTQNSQQGCLPLSLINAERRNNRNRAFDVKKQSQGPGFTKKQSIIQKLQLSSNKTGKQNLSYTSSSFAKNRKQSQNSRNEGLTAQKKHQIRRFYCQDTEHHLQTLNMNKKIQSRHLVSQYQYEQQNQFSDIQLKQQNSTKLNNPIDKKYGLQKKGIRNKLQNPISKQDIQINNKQNYTLRQRNHVQRDQSPMMTDLSRRKKSYKYYFQE